MGNAFSIHSVLPTLNIEDVFSTNTLKPEKEVNPIYGKRYLNIKVLGGGFMNFLRQLPELDFLSEGEKITGYNTKNLQNLHEASMVEIQNKEGKLRVIIKKILVKPDVESAINVFGTYIES